jgi:predicted AlkP superfamily pyrophosphatase or phosphodiesterase
VTTAPVYPITAIAPTVTTVLGLPAPRQAEEPPIPEIRADLMGVARVAVLAPDAVGLTVWQRWREATPFLTSLHEQRHLVLRSVPPPITPVNFAALVTGAPLEAHGLHERTAKLRAESIFDVIRATGGGSAGVGQPGYTGGDFLARYAEFSGRTDASGDDAVLEMVLRLARAHQPRFIIAQLGDPDTLFHKVGPSSPEAEPVMRATDARLRRLTEELATSGYAVIVLADHGQHEYTDDSGSVRGGHDGSEEEDFLVPCTWVR